MHKNISRLSVLIASAVALMAGGFAQEKAPPKTPEPLAVIGGQPIYENELLPLIQSQLMQLRSQEYSLRSNALDHLINQKLLEAEAKSKGLSAEKLLDQEVDSKVPEPTDAEMQAFYQSQKERINQPYEQIKAQLQQNLKQTKVQQVRQEYFKRLRTQFGVTVFLRPARVEVAVDLTRLRGSATAPVNIVEFSDFQCPYCRLVQPTLKELLAKYGDRVSLSYRDFPLREIHPQAQLAAEASRCAAEQGKFWEYHDALYSTTKFNKEMLTEQARKVGVDAKQFDACLSGGKYRAQIEQDLQEGSRAGASGTPAFFINGVFLNGAQPASAFEKIIEEELAAAQKRTVK